MELIKQFQQTIDIQNYSQKTKKAYSFHIEKFINFCNNNPLQELILPYLGELANKKHYKSSSLNLAKYSLIYFFKTLNQEIYVKIPLIKRDKLLPKTLEKIQIKKLIEKIKNLKHRCLVEIAYSSGLRPGEAVKVQWLDLDFDRKKIRINQGKGKKDRISILSEKVIIHLKDYRGIRENQNSEYVFDSLYRPKTHIVTRTFQEILKKASKKARFGFIVNPHRLRHSFAKHLLDDGYDISYIQKLLGHSSIKTTRIYLGITDKDICKIKSPLDSDEFNTPKKIVKINNGLNN